MFEDDSISELTLTADSDNEEPFYTPRSPDYSPNNTSSYDNQRDVLYFNEDGSVEVNGDVYYPQSQNL